jgi:CheY-like chemotaxis protein
VECGHGLFQPKHLLSELETIVKETFPRSIQLRTHVPPDLWSINGDFTQLYQVLLNLCVNARDAMPNGGSLTMEAENVLLDEQAARMHVNARPGPYVVLSVADTGAGIPPHLIEKIFDPFFTTKERGKGTGLGLSTVLGIVKSHNGFVKVYSEVGKGTQMKVFLPAEAADSTPDHDASASEPVDGRGELVLVVDDEASIAEMMKAMLEAHSYRVLTAKDGAEAVGLYAKHVGEVHVVITDMMMPVMDGRATIRALQKLDPGVKIVAVSGLPTNDMIVETIGGSAVPILPKPYSTGKVLTLLRQVLNDQTPTGTG